MTARRYERVTPATSADPVDGVIEQASSHLDLLLDDTIPFDRACAEIADRQMRGNPAPQSVVDAVMYALRPGTAALSRANVQGYLAMVDEQQMRAMAKQLQHRNPKIARSWTPDEVEMLINAWADCHGR
jgi:hypothetical protein